jgi:hypothetical protein
MISSATSTAHREGELGPGTCARSVHAHVASFLREAHRTYGVKSTTCGSWSLTWSW